MKVAFQEIAVGGSGLCCCKDLEVKNLVVVEELWFFL